MYIHINTNVILPALPMTWAKPIPWAGPGPMAPRMCGAAGPWEEPRRARGKTSGGPSMCETWPGP